MSRNESAALMTMKKARLADDIRREKVYQDLLRKVESGEITPDEAECEYDFAMNGADSFQNIYGY